MAIGEEVDAALTKLFHNFNRNYVGNDSVFPLELGAPYSRLFMSALSTLNSETSIQKGPGPRRSLASEGPTTTASQLLEKF